MEGGLLGKIANSNTGAFLLLVVLVLVIVALGYAVAGAVGDKVPAPIAAILAPARSHERQASF